MLFAIRSSVLDSLLSGIASAYHAGMTWTPAMNDELLAWIASGQARDWRKAARLTLVQAAAEVEVSWNTVAAWEKSSVPADQRQKPTGHARQRYYARLKVWRRLAEQAALSRQDQP